MLITLAAITLVFIKAWIDGKFDSIESFQQYAESYGAMAPVMLIVFQIIQVILPVLPGLFGCAVGTIMFGPMASFWCNYIGISAGSILAFALARKYGQGLVDTLFDYSKYEKWATKAGESKSYTAFLFMAMLLPLFPDDYLCYFSGLTKMTYRKFIWIILLGKPWCILAYCIGFSFLG